MLLQHLQGWGHDHFPGELAPVLDHPVSEELVPSIQSSPSIMLKYRGEIFFFSVSSNGKNTWN